MSDVLLDRLAMKYEVDAAGCWVWTASTDSRGYGAFWNGSRMAKAHRMSYELTVGPVPAGLQLDHLCRNRLCINPDHLEPVTAQENVRRGDAGKKWRDITHCPHGHEYNEANTYHYRGRRYCRACNRVFPRGHNKRATA